MHARAIRLCWLLLALLGSVASAIGAELEHRTWVVDGITREALVSIPADATQNATPVVFAFHGHGGTMGHASRSFPLHRFWPGAIVVYPQGLPTPTPLVDKEGTQNGWQPAADAQHDRDLKFFDVMLADLRAKYCVDDRRIYATGHSNGGQFTYLLWAERGAVLAAIAPSSAVLAHGYEKFRPLPVLHIAGLDDPLVRFAWQERMIALILRVNGCGPRQPAVAGYVTYPSSRNAEVATYLHPGGHKFDETATPLIVRFFQAHPKR